MATIDDIEKSIPSSFGSDVAINQKETVDWMKKWAQLNDREVKVLSKGEIVKAAAHSYPYASKERLVIICRFYHLAVLLDDYLMSLERDDILKFRDRCEKISKNPTLLKSDDHRFVICWTEIWKSFCALSPKQWQSRFLNTFKVYVTSIYYEKQFIEEVRIPTEAEFVLRAFSYGGCMAIDFVEFANDIYLTEKQLGCYVIREIFHASDIITARHNDLLSFEKELKSGEKFNMIMVLKEHRNVSYEKARELVLMEIDAALQRYLFLTRETEQFLALYPDDFDRYIKGLDCLIRGIYDFHNDSRRYANDPVLW